jgi:hypothetical protein
MLTKVRSLYIEEERPFERDFWDFWTSSLGSLSLSLRQELSMRAPAH